MSALELLAYLAIGVIGGFAALVLFAAVGSSVLRREIDEHRARKELLQAQRLEDESERQVQTAPNRSKSLELRRSVHRVEPRVRRLREREPEGVGR